MAKQIPIVGSLAALSTAEATAAAVSGLAGNFMVSGRTYARGAELGFGGIDFYFAGRGGVLGDDVAAEAVSAALVVFRPDLIKQALENSRTVMPRVEAATHFAECAHSWGIKRMPDELDSARLAALAGRVVDSASPAAAPIFAGWRLLPVPDHPKAAAVHHMNGLRELRFALHGAAVVTSGLSVADAVWHNSPHLAPGYGWFESPLEGRENEVRGLWEEAEAATNRGMAVAFGVLDEGEQEEFCALAAAALAANPH